MPVSGPGFASREDIPVLQELWQVCFQSRWEAFFAKRFRPEETVVWRERGQVLASMMILPVWLRKQPGVYVYAVSTFPQARGRGLMRQLDAFAMEVARSRGAQFSCLIPATESLFSLYAQLGYERAFSRQEGKVEKAVLWEPLTDCEEAQFLAAQAHVLQDWPDCLCLPEADRRFLYRDWLAEGGRVLSDTTGYVMCLCEDDRILIRECSGDVEKMAQNLLAHFPARVAEYAVPGPGVCRGMGRMLDNRRFSEVFGSQCTMPMLFE